MSRWERRIPHFDLANLIPRVIHQTYPSQKLPLPLQANVEYLKASNPDWEHRLYDDAAIDKFIGRAYGSKVLKAYQRINPRYGAARADLFRYLLIYCCGGVYLDIKSTFERPIEEVISLEGGLIVSQWRNDPDGQHPNFGLHRELAHIDGGEFQQWHIIAPAGHPLLRKVIIRVLDNLDRYRPWRMGIGKAGVMRTTGPIPYTLALEGLNARHRRIAHEGEIGLVYSIAGEYDHLRVFKGHYSTQDSSVVDLPLWAKPLGNIAIAYRRFRNSRRDRAF